MQKKLFLHVGPPKTGTTTLQHFLAANRDQLFEAGIVYPLEEPSHWKLALCSGLTMWPWTVDESTTCSWEAIRQASSEYFDKDLLLSSESFSYAFLPNKKESSAHFLNQIKSLGREIHVIIYLRRQDLWIESYFIEYLKHYGKGGFEFFFAERKDSLYYDRVLSFWASIAEKNCLNVRVFEQGQMQNFRSDFLQWLGISDTSGFRKWEDKNHRPTLLQMQVLYNYVDAFHQRFPEIDPNFNKPFGPLDQILGRFLYETSNWPSTRDFKILSYETAKRILDDCAMANASVAQEYFGRKDGRLFFEELLPYKNDPLDFPISLNEDQQLKIASLWKNTCELMGEVYGASPVCEEWTGFEKMLCIPPAGNSISFSVERYLPDMTDFQISYEHWHRYLFATHFAVGKNVLDIACGDGYGTALLAEYAAQVTGVDIDNQVIQVARRKYHRKNISFLQGTVTDIPVEGLAKFDIIVSFETIEHVDEMSQTKFLNEVLRLLRPGGLFIVSTPDKLAYTDQPNYHNEFHVREFYANEFSAFLQSYFPNVQILGQDIYTVSYLHTKASRAKLEEYNLALSRGFHPERNIGSSDLYMVAVCSTNKLPALPHSLLFNSENKRAQYDYNFQMLYVDTGNGFNEEESLFTKVVEKRTSLRFDLSGFSNVKNLRFDPAACPVCLRLLDVTLEFGTPASDGATLKHPISISSNALQQDGAFFLFDSDDPQVYLELPKLVNLKAIIFELEYIATGTAVFPYLKYRVSESEVKIVELVTTMGHLESEINNQLQSLETGKTLLEKAEQHLALQQKLAEKAEVLLMEKTNAFNALANRLDNSESLLLLKEEQIRLSAEHLSQILATMQSLEAMLTERNLAVKEKETEIRLLLKEAGAALQTIEALSSVLSRRETELDEQRKQHRQLEEIHLMLDAKLASLQYEKTAVEQKLVATCSNLEILQNRFSEEQLKLGVLQNQLAEENMRVKVLGKKTEEQEKHIRYIEDRIAELENSIYEKESSYARLSDGYREQVKYLNEIKNSVSFQLGWALTAPLRWLYDGLKLRFWLKFANIASRHPYNFFRHISIEKIGVLLKALKNEPPSVILNNFVNLLNGSAPQHPIVSIKEIREPFLLDQPDSSLEQEVPIIHYFIDEIEELDFHISIRGWLFAENQELVALYLSMMQGEHVVRSEVFYKIDRPDVFQHYGNKNGLCSGFADSLEKPYTGKVQLSLHAVLGNGFEFRLDIGEAEFREPMLIEYGKNIRINRSAFLISNGTTKGIKRVIDIYTHTEGNYFFNEIKSLMAAGFRKLGYETRELNENDRFDPSSLLHVIVAPHEFFEMKGGERFTHSPSDKMILLNTEQPSSFWFRKAAAYFPLAIDVWDMNFYSWQKLNKTLGGAHFLPLGFVKNFNLLGEVRNLPNNYCTCFLDDKIRKRSFLQSRFEERPIDILFVGHASPRRQQFFARHASFFARYNCYFHLTDLSLGPIRNNNTAMNTRTAIGLAQRSKIILNIHHGSHPYFEWHRMVMHGIWQRGLVVSDVCGEGPPFVSGKHFIQAPLDELPERITYFLETDTGRIAANEIIQSAWATLTTECDLAGTLRSLMSTLLASTQPPLTSYEASFQ